MKDEQWLTQQKGKESERIFQAEEHVKGRSREQGKMQSNTKAHINENLQVKSYAALTFFGKVVNLNAP